MARLEALWSFAGALDKGDLFPVNYERVLCLPTVPWFFCDPVPILKFEGFFSFFFYFFFSISPI